MHRDIKPGNIMLRRRDGYAKVLDFGLAKLTDSSSVATDPAAPTRAQVMTDAGVVMGTAGYMSPEQVRGEQVDARTDIWSFGVVLYEMVAGCAPFERSTPSEVIALILEREPPPLARYARAVPAELERIVEKALTKVREERYQTAKDLLVDLRRLRQRLEVEAEIERSASPETSEKAASATARSQAVATDKQTGALTQTEIGRPSGAEHLITAIKRHRWTALFGIAALATLAAVITYFGFFAKGGKAIDSIAVMPFVNVNADPNTEYLADGISESIINQLSLLPNLKVMSSNAVFHYKGHEVDALVVGRELSVRAVLKGRIVQHGDEVVISVELVDARDNSHLWGERYERKLTEVLLAQREITQGITKKLRLSLTGEDQKRVNKQYTENPEAYQSYLKARYYWNKRTPDWLKKAIEYYQQAVDEDPNYALAYAGMADCYTVPANPLPPKEKMARAKGAARKALEIDDTLAEAHTTLGRVLTVYDWDWSGAAKEFQRAIELDPRSAEAHKWYGSYWQAVGRSDESIAERRRALELDPLSPIINFELIQGLYFARKYDEAIEQSRKSLELDTSFGPFYAFPPRAYEQKGMYGEAITGFQKAITEARDYRPGTMPMAGLGHVYAVASRKGEAQEVLNELKQLDKQEYVPAVAIALIYAGLGEKDQAFAWLEKAHDAHDFEMTWLKVEPRWDSLRPDPRFADLLQRMGLQP